MTQYWFQPIWVESTKPFDPNHTVNWLTGSSPNAWQETPASQNPGTSDDVNLDGRDLVATGNEWNSVADGILDSGDLTVFGDASSIAVAMAGQPFKLANGSGGQTSFTPTVGTAILTANQADLSVVGASGEIIAPTVDTVFVDGGTVSATTITNLTDGVTGIVPGVDMYKQSYDGAIKGFTDGGTVSATNIIGENPVYDLIFMSGAGDGIKGTISAGNIYALSGGMAVEVVGTNQTLTVVNYENFSDSPGGLTDDLIVVSGGTVNITGSDQFGQMAGDEDTVTISGKGALLSLGATPFEIGVSGSAVFDVDSGGTAISQQGLNAGLASSGDATIVVSGSGALLSAESFDIGGAGSATMQVQGGGKVVAASDVDIGVDPTGIGSLFVTGSATTFSATTSTFEVGVNGSGSFNVGSGQKFTGHMIDVAEFSGATGTVNVNSAQITVSSMDVGGGPNAAGGDGTVNLTNGGRLLVNDNMQVWDSGTVTLSAPSSSSDSQAVVIGNLVNGGTVSAGQYGDFAVSGSVSGTGDIDIGALGVVSLRSSVGSGQTIEFQGAKAELVLAAPASFSADISGFGPSDIIDLANIPFNTGSKVKVVGNTVIVTPTTGSPVQLNFGSTPPNAFVLQKDTANGSTDVVIGPPAVTSVSTNPSSGSAVHVGETVDIVVDLNDAVTVIGTPALKLSDGGIAYYTSGSSNPSSGTLEFAYTVSAGQTSTDLTIAGAAVVSGASIKDSGNQSAPLSFTAAEKNLGLTVHGIPPVVSSLTAVPASGGTITSGGSAVITVKFSEAVNVTGTPFIQLNNGGSAGYVSGTGTSALTFAYSAANETTTDLEVIGINETGGTITDAAGNELSPNLTSALHIAVNVDAWAHGSSGNFATGGDWTLAAPPTSSQEASLSVAGTYKVSVGSGASDTVAALNIGDKTATLLVTSSGSFTATSGTGVDASLGTLAVNDGGTLALGGTANNAGTIALTANAPGTTLGIAGALTLTGGGKVSLSATTGNALSIGGTGVTLTNVNNTIAGGGTVSNTGLTFVNSGSVDANTAAALTIDTGANTISNFGKLEATASGGLDLDSDVTNSGTIAALGTQAKVLLTGVTVSGPGTLLASGVGALVELDGAVISGGTLKTSGASAAIETIGNTTNNVISGATVVSGGLVEVTGGTVLALSNVTINSGGTVLILSGGSAILGATPTNAGSIVINGGGSLVAASGGLTLEGAGKIALSGGTISTIGTSTTFENVNNTIKGSGTIGGDAFLTFENLGTVEATGSVPLTINTGSNTITNAGIAEALGTKAELVIDSNVTNTDLVEALGTGATVVLNSATVDNLSGSIVASGTGAVVELDNATVSDGTFKTSSGGAIEAIGGGGTVINGGTVTSRSLIEVASGSTLTLSGTIVSAGAVIETMSGAGSGGALTGGVLIVSGVTNSGTLFASGAHSLVQISGTLNGGTAEVGNGIVSIQSSDENVTFQSGGSGQLQLFDYVTSNEAGSRDYTGTVSSFGQNIHQSIDLVSAPVSSGTNVSSTYAVEYFSAGNSGTLVVTTSGGLDVVAQIALIGHYKTANFSLVADFPSSNSSVGTLEIIDPPVVGGGIASITPLGNYMASMFVTSAIHGGTLTTETPTSQQPLLTHPHA